MDPTTGQSLSREDLSERLEPYKRQSGLVDDYDVPLGLYLQAATPRDIIARMLRNLKEVHRSQQDWQRLTAVLDRWWCSHPRRGVSGGTVAWPMPNWATPKKRCKTWKPTWPTPKTGWMPTWWPSV